MSKDDVYNEVFGVDPPVYSGSPTALALISDAHRRPRKRNRRLHPTPWIKAADREALINALEAYLLDRGVVRGFYVGDLDHGYDIAWLARSLAEAFPVLVNAQTQDRFRKWVLLSLEDRGWLVQGGLLHSPRSNNEV